MSVFNMHNIIFWLHFVHTTCHTLWTIKMVAVYLWLYLNSLFTGGIYSCFQACKSYWSDQDFPKLWSQMYCHLFIVHSVCKVYIIWHTFGCILLRRLLEQIDKRITTKATGCFCVVVKLIALYCVSFNHYFSMLRSDNRIINELSIYLSIRVYPFAFVAHCWNYIPRVVPLLSDCLVSDGVQENINFLHVLSCISLSIIAWRCIAIRRVLNAEKSTIHYRGVGRNRCFYFPSLPFSPRLLSVAAGRETRGAFAPDGTVQGRHLKGWKWNYEILLHLANWYLHCRQINSAP